MANKSPVKIALADDHIVLRNALAGLIDNFEDCKVICQANDGNELLTLIKNDITPDIVILDLNMPNMNGFDTAVWLKKNFPAVKILMLTMYDSEMLLIRLLQVGVSGFLKKDIHPSELKQALQVVMEVGYYYSSHTTNKIVNLFQQGDGDNMLLQNAMLNDQEVYFLKLTCTEMTYKEIAMQMNLNPRAVDSLRDHLFEKLDVKSRVGLALLALRKGIVTL